MKFLSKHRIILFFLFIISLMPFLWLSGNNILLGYDNAYPLNPLAFLTDRLFSWSSTQGFGFDQSGQQGTLILHFIDSIPQFLGFSVQLSQKIVFSFWFFMMIFSSYIFIVTLEKYELIKSNYLRYLFPVLYSVNFYILQAWWVAERAKFSLVIATPLILSIVFPMIKEKLSFASVLKKSILSSFVLLVFSGGGWGGLPLFGGLILALFCFTIFYSFIFYFIGRKKDIIYLYEFDLVLGFLFLLLNAYTFLPFLSTVLSQFGYFLGAEGGVAGVVSWTKYLSQNASFINLLRLQGIPDWYSSTHPYSGYYLSNPFLIFVSFLIPLILFTSFLKIYEKSKSTYLFFLFLLIVSIIFTAGARDPLGFIFEFLMYHVPGFLIFRSAIFKFGYIYWFCVSLFVGLGLSLIIDYLVSKFRNRTYLSLMKVFLPVLFMGFLVLYHFPYITGSIFNIEKTSVSARVTVPDYVYEFSKWWSLRQEKNRILLLPSLNNNVYFDQYKWNYMSLFPLLGDFANQNIVFNSSVLYPNEQVVIESFYKSINDKNYKSTDYLASLLGIKYFLVREDFYSNLPQQETDNPLEVEKKLTSNPNIKKEINFGKWSVYSYKNNNPFIYSKSSGVLSEGNALSYSSDMENGSLVVDQLANKINPHLISSVNIYPDCLSCIAEREDISVTFPKPQILIDSPFYELSKKLNKNKQLPDDYSNYIGNTLLEAGQLSELMNQGKKEQYIAQARDEYVATLESLYNNILLIFARSRNPYDTSIVLQQYLKAEDAFISDLITKTDDANLVTSLQSIIYEINKVSSRLSQFYRNDYKNIKKIYKFHVSVAGQYEPSIRVESLGSIVSDINSISASIDGAATIFSGSLVNGNVVFGKTFLSEGDHLLTLNLPQQKNLFTSPILENVSGRACYSSIINNFSLKNNYELTFVSSNNSNANFYFFADNNVPGYPAIAYYIPVGSKKKQFSHMVSSSLPFNKNSHTLRLAFCSDTLNIEDYATSIKDVSFVQLTEPIVVLRKTSVNVNKSEPMITFTKINETNYDVQVKDAKGPFYLVFGERFSPSWKASLGEHFMANGFSNAWYINRKGSFTLNINYNPQKYVYLGFAISVITFLSLAIYLLKKKNK